MPDFTYANRMQVLEHCIELVKKFSTDRIRCFDFWRLEDLTPYRTAINENCIRLPKRWAKD